MPIKKKIKIKKRKIDKKTNVANEKTTSVKFRFHPVIEDKDFYNKLFQKKEFHKFQYKIETRKME